MQFELTLCGGCLFARDEMGFDRRPFHKGSTNSRAEMVRQPWKVMVLMVWMCTVLCHNSS